MKAPSTMQTEMIQQLETLSERIEALPKSDFTHGARNRCWSAIECLRQDIEFQSAKAAGKDGRKAFEVAVQTVQKTWKEPQKLTVASPEFPRVERETVVRES